MYKNGNGQCARLGKSSVKAWDWENTAGSDAGSKNNTYPCHNHALADTGDLSQHRQLHELVSKRITLLLQTA